MECFCIILLTVWNKCIRFLKDILNYLTKLRAHGMSPIINIYKLYWENKVTVWISSPLPPPII